MRRVRSDNGSVMPLLILFMVLVSIIGAAVGGSIVTTLKVAVDSEESEAALAVAEAGIHYYLWHLDHDGTDYTDGHGAMTIGTDGYGPFVHTSRDAAGNVAGEFTLYIKPDTLGSTIVTIRSTGKTKTGTVSKTIEARLGAWSYSAYAVASNSALWFGATETADGPVFSNVGVKMDGPSNDTVSSANAQYTVPSSHGYGANTVKPGVWCDPNVTSPTNCNTRNKSQWVYPATSLDFNRLSYDLCDLKKLATGLTGSTACQTIPSSRTSSYVPPVSASSYNQNVGYLVVLNSGSPATYSLYKVTNERDNRPSASQALTTTLVQANIPVPSSGVVFVEDNVWLMTADNAGFDGRITVVAARLAATGSANLVFADDVIYKSKDGTDVIGGIPQNNIEIAPYSGIPLEIDGAYIAKDGTFTYRLKYRTTGGYTEGWVNQTEKFTFYGSVVSNSTWTWSWTLCSQDWKKACWAGFEWNITTYDDNLRYSPPPSFPVTNTFDILSWREILTTP